MNKADLGHRSVCQRLRGSPLSNKVAIRSSATQGTLQLLSTDMPGLPGLFLQNGALRYAGIGSNVFAIGR